VFQINDLKAWITVLISAVSYSLGLFMIAKSPWYLLPLAWAWTGTAVTGFFVIGHDCAHKSFANNKLLEDIVGTLAFLPLIYPYEPWRFKHDRHHAKTNMWVQFCVKLPSSNVI
jgi:omega-6 fatty acid desaturase (delta-12 desaturase)